MSLRGQMPQEYFSEATRSDCHRSLPHKSNHLLRCPFGPSTSLRVTKEEAARRNAVMLSGVEA